MPRNTARPHLSQIFYVAGGKRNDETFSVFPSDRLPLHLLCECFDFPCYSACGRGCWMEVWDCLASLCPPACWAPNGGKATKTPFPPCPPANPSFLFSTLLRNSFSLSGPFSTILYIPPASLWVVNGGGNRADRPSLSAFLILQEQIKEDENSDHFGHSFKSGSYRSLSELSRGTLYHVLGSATSSNRPNRDIRRRGARPFSPFYVSLPRSFINHCLHARGVLCSSQP